MSFRQMTGFHYLKLGHDYYFAHFFFLALLFAVIQHRLYQRLEIRYKWILKKLFHVATWNFPRPSSLQPSPPLPLLPFQECFGCLRLTYSHQQGGRWQSPDTKGGFTHSMPCPCRSPAMPCVNSHLPCRTPALFRQCRVLRESPRGSRKYPNC
jgi:hypothetical protein